MPKNPEILQPRRGAQNVPTIPSFQELQLLSWAARLVRLVAAGECPRTLRQFDEEVCEPIRRIAFEMRDAATPLPVVMTGEEACEHGVAWDVHCCGCHSGFLFDSRKCVCF